MRWLFSSLAAGRARRIAAHLSPVARCSATPPSDRLSGDPHPCRHRQRGEDAGQDAVVAHSPQNAGGRTRHSGAGRTGVQSEPGRRLAWHRSGRDHRRQRLGIGLALGGTYAYARTADRRGRRPEPPSCDRSDCDSSAGHFRTDRATCDRATGHCRNRAAAVRAQSRQHLAPARRGARRADRRECHLAGRRDRSRSQGLGIRRRPAAARGRRFGDRRRFSTARKRSPSPDFWAREGASRRPFCGHPGGRAKACCTRSRGVVSGSERHDTPSVRALP